jgi:hypothetical protein
VWNPPPPRPSPAALADPAPPLDAEYVFTRDDLTHVIPSIRASLGCGAVPLDSPQRLQDALRTVIAGLGGCGDVTVRRSPAALLTPEYWHVSLRGLDGATAAALRTLLADARR